jgi:type I restriction enzyme S subunit
MEVKRGYKQTEVGVIPEDWEVKPLESVAFVTSGKRLPLGRTLTTQATPHPYVRVTDMRPGTVSLAEIMFVPVDVFPSIQRYRIYKEDLFISVAGTLGIVGKIPPELHGANLTENADRITSISCSQDYLLHVLMSPSIQRLIDSLQTIGAQPKLALARIRRFDIPLPPTRAEQEAIAGALSHADALIESLEQLLTKKRQIKQGAMRELLTGKKRLPGFTSKPGYKQTEVGVIPEDWEVKRLGDVAPIATGNTPPTRDPQNYGDEFLFVSPVDMGWSKYISRTEKMLSKKGFSISRPFPARSVLFVCIGSTIGKCGIAAVPLTSNQQINAIFPSETVIADYLYYAVCLVAGKIRSLAGEQAVPIVNKSQFSEAAISLPSTRAEQTAIAAVLSDMDAETAALETKLAKARQVKQGMMQELLTGRIRLV